MRWHYVILLLFLINLMSLRCFSFVFSRTEGGKIVKWGDNIKNINIFTNSLNGKGFTDQSISDIFEQSIFQWNGLSRLTTSMFSIQEGPKNNRNDLYFSNSSLLFTSSSVLGVTQVVFNEETGVIFEADIIINDNIPYSLDKQDVFYLGNIVTHELGHFLGQGHGQVKDSTMFFSISAGLYQLSQDDKAGIFSHYPVGVMGSIEGIVMGGQSLTGVLGAHVEVLSTLTGEVAGAAFTEEDGTFKVDGLALDDTYYLYIAPAEELASLPGLFSSTQNNFCNSGAAYRGSFYQSCLSSEIGSPVGIELTSLKPSVNVGKITIRCSQEVPIQYFKDKSDNVPSGFTLGTKNSNGGLATVGFFTVNDINTSNKDEYLLDYSGLSLGTADLYLDIKISGHKFGDQYVEELSGGVRNYTKVDLALDVDGVIINEKSEADGVINYDREYLLPLDSVSANNIFNVHIIPSKIGATFPSSLYLKSFNENLIFYLMTVSVLRKKSDGVFVSFAQKKYAHSFDNRSCPDAANTYFVPAKIVSSANTLASNLSSGDDEKKNFSVSCATIDLGGGGNGNGPLSFVIGFLMISLFKRFNIFQYLTWIK